MHPNLGPAGGALRWPEYHVAHARRPPLPPASAAKYLGIYNWHTSILEAAHLGPDY